MIFRPHSVPEEAEAIDAAPFFAKAKKPSRFVPGAEALVSVFHCPGCRRSYPPLCQLEVAKCENCGLVACLSGSFLYVWRALVPAKEPADA